MNRTNMASYFVAACVFGVTLFQSTASAVVVTVTSGPNQGVVFNSGGYEGVAAGSALTASSATTGTYASPSGAGIAASTIITTGTAGGPGAAYSGSNFLAIPRVSSTYFLFDEFSRSINLATESFKVEFAFWSTATSATAFAIGDSSAIYGNSPSSPTTFTTAGTTSATVSVPGVLAGFRFNTGGTPAVNDLTQYLNSTQGGSGAGAITDELAALTNYNNGTAWNTMVYAWDASTQSGTYTLNGTTVNAAPRVATGSSYGAPLTVNRLLLSPGVNNSTIWVDSIAAVPEPTTVGVLGIAGVMTLVRRRRAH